MSSDLPLSLCVTVSGGADPSALGSFLQDLSIFFQRFPVPYEVLLATTDQSPNEWQGLEQKFAVLKIQRRPHREPAAKMMIHLLEKARGHVLITYPLDQGLPLAELFKILQNLLSESELEVIFTQRRTQKSFEKDVRLQALPAWERLLSDILKEKNRWPFQDAFAPVIGLKSEAFAKIRGGLGGKTDLTLEIQTASLEAGLRWRELAVIPSSREAPRRYGIWARLRLLSFVLFRIRGH